MYSLPQRQVRAVNMSRDFVTIMVLGWITHVHLLTVDLGKAL